MSELIDLADHRPPVCYTVRLAQHWDGRLEIFVEDVSDDERSRKAVADALRRAANHIDSDAKFTLGTQDSRP